MGMQGGGKLWHHQKQHSSVMPIIQLSAWLFPSVLVVDVIARSLFSEAKFIMEVHRLITLLFTSLLRPLSHVMAGMKHLSSKGLFCPMRCVKLSCDCTRNFIVLSMAASPGIIIDIMSCQHN